MKLKNMLLLSGAAFLSIFALASCGGSNTTTSTTTNTNSTTTTTQNQNEEKDLLLFVDDNNIYYDKNILDSEGITLKIDDKTAVLGNNAFTSSSTIKFEGTTGNKLYIYMVGMTKDNNEESYTFSMSYGLNASTAEGMNVATKKLKTLMANKTKVFVSVSTRADDWNKTLSLKLNSYIERNSQGGF